MYCRVEVSDLVGQGQDGFQVLVAHQLAQVLDMPFARDVRLVLGRLGQGLAQRIGQRQAVQLLGRQTGQAFAQILQRMQLALDLCLALFAQRRVVVVRINHELWGPAKNGRHHNELPHGCPAWPRRP